MSLKNYVVEGCSFEIYENGIVNTSGTVSVVSAASTNTKIDGKGVYTTLLVTVEGFTSSDSSHQPWISGSGATVTPAQISASAQKNKVDSLSVVLEGDEAQDVTIVGQKQQGQTTVPEETTVTIKVKSAGQSSVKGD